MRLCPKPCSALRDIVSSSASKFSQLWIFVANLPRPAGLTGFQLSTYDTRAVARSKSPVSTSLRLFDLDMDPVSTRSFKYFRLWDRPRKPEDPSSSCSSSEPYSRVILIPSGCPVMFWFRSSRLSSEAARYLYEVILEEKKNSIANQRTSIEVRYRRRVKSHLQVEITFLVYDPLPLSRLQGRLLWPHLRFPSLTEVFYGITNQKIAHFWSSWKRRWKQMATLLI